MHVEIWSDIACPWCYVGKRRFETALAGFEHAADVRVTWRSFELDPAAPAEREHDVTTHLAEKYGTSREQAEAMEQRMTETAAAEGLDFRFDLVRSGNTFDAHRLLHLAAANDLQDAMKERLMRAYLTEGAAIGNPDVLQGLAVEVGIPADEAADLLAGDLFADEVRVDERTAAGLGIHAVPFFVIDRALGASGAQSFEFLTKLLAKAWEQRSPLTLVGEGEGEGDACAVDGC